ncbi:MAG: hypothetical protein KF773_03030 [Deltaproteobacteria bacterium]|nr:hypothetical protein [Deltaproteobacteria bacterium]MCW5806921.1 hypothetical protein [Deltaproteobacteria bacterium]
MTRLALVVVLVAACGGGGGSSDVPAIDAPAGPKCTGAVFDVCTANAECMSNNCHLFRMAGFSVCTAACTPGDNTTCPVDSTGVNGFCNNMGICKPAAPNDCSP